MTPEQLLGYEEPQPTIPQLPIPTIPPSVQPSSEVQPVQEDSFIKMLLILGIVGIVGIITIGCIIIFARD